MPVGKLLGDDDGGGGGSSNGDNKNDHDKINGDVIIHYTSQNNFGRHNKGTIK